MKSSEKSFCTTVNVFENKFKILNTIEQNYKSSIAKSSHIILYNYRHFLSDQKDSKENFKTEILSINGKGISLMPKGFGFSVICCCQALCKNNLSKNLKRKR